MVYKGLFTYGFSWKIFGKTAQVGNRLKLQPSKTIEGAVRLAEMVEDAEGVFVFLPRPDSIFYEGMDQKKVLEYTNSINLTLEKLNALGKELEKNQKKHVITT